MGENKKFKFGDLVILKSESFKNNPVIMIIITYINNAVVKCQWIDLNGVPRSMDYHEDILILSDEFFKKLNEHYNNTIKKYEKN
jgi:uncharacterized protein YodC (DUF2158 family)